MDYPGKMEVLDLSEGYDPEFLASKEWTIGKYNEKRRNMYSAPQFEKSRCIHMGIDIWTRAGAPVYAFYEGRIAYVGDNNRKGDYGGTIVTVHQIGNEELFALYGHLSKKSLSTAKMNREIDKGEQIAELGTPEENGGWPPHLHFQLSWENPGEADMPGVVAEEDREWALKTYPDPRMVLGELY